MHTLSAAAAMGVEDSRGSIEPGKLADFIVVDRDPLSCPEEEIASIRVEQVFIGGELVYAAQEVRQGHLTA
jgi:predicted amidohydrolase YtcJ